MKEEIKPITVLLTDIHLKESNREQVKQLFLDAINIAKEKGLNSVVSLGDIFDSRKSQPLENLTTFSEILELFVRYDIQFYSIVGNHDKIDQSKVESYLTPYKYHPYFRLIDDLEILPFGETELIFLPYFTEEVYRKKLDRLLPMYTEESILLTHIDVQGYTMNSGQVAQHGFSGSLFSKFKKVLIGHYHDCSSKGNIEYIGSSLQHNYGETGTDKGVKILYSDGSVSLEKQSDYIQSFSTFRVNSLVEFENLKIDDVPGHKRIVFTGTKEELIQISKGDSTRIKELLETSKLEFKEVQTETKDFEERSLQTSLSKDQIKEIYIDWCIEEEIEEGEREEGIQLLNTIKEV